MPWYRSLPVQILLLLSLAALPLGAISIYQTKQVAEQAERNAELALLNITARAVKSEELIIEHAVGAARFFATVAEDYVNAPEKCQADLGAFIEDSPQYSLIAILPLSGLMTCSSSGESFDFSNYSNFRQLMKARVSSISVNQNAPLSGTSVFIVSEPFELEGKFAGFISVSVPHDGLPEPSDRLSKLGLEELITFNETGTILTARDDITEAGQRLPTGIALADMNTATAKAFTARNRNGEKRTYTIVPIQGSPASALGIWRTKDSLASDTKSWVNPAVFPILMWAASLAVAMLSVYMLVLRHLSRLQSAMDRFSRDRTLPKFDGKSVVPNEVQALRDNFSSLATSILQDEARLEDAVREKGVLVKEIHHRVKNNLQLISSIMNMQIRNADHEETRQVISSLQDRVRSLATIHRDLHQSQSEGRVNAGALVTEILENSVEMAASSDDPPDVQSEIDPVLLFPDQAVPLSLLAAEAMTNTLKYLGNVDEKRPWVTARLTQDGKNCTFALANSTVPNIKRESTGLGSDLISAFAIQLGGQVEISEGENRYEMQVRFNIAEFVPDPRDY